MKSHFVQTLGFSHELEEDGREIDGNFSVLFDAEHGHLEKFIRLLLRLAQPNSVLVILVVAESLSQLNILKNGILTLLGICQRAVGLKLQNALFHMEKQSSRPHDGSTDRRLILWNARVVLVLLPEVVHCCHFLCELLQYFAQLVADYLFDALPALDGLEVEQQLQCSVRGPQLGKRLVDERVRRFIDA
jgi:hypothetical protein